LIKSLPQENINMSLIESSPDVETIELPRKDRRVQLPEEGISYPNPIILPSATAPRATILSFGQSLGINLPQRYNRTQMLEHIVEIIREFGYQQDEGNIYTRDRPMLLIYEDRNIRPAENIELPEIIPYEVFTTRDSVLTFLRAYNLDSISAGSGRLKRDLVRDLREFLSEHGYAVDTQGNFFHAGGGATIEGGYELPDLINVQQYHRLIVSPNQIEITQADLNKLNISLTHLTSSLKSRRWPSLRSFAESAGGDLQISPDVMELVALLAHLPRENNQTLTSLLHELGNIQSYQSLQDRRDAIYSYLRPKLVLIPKTYDRREQFEGNATSTMTFLEAIEGGHTFEWDQYSEELRDLLGYNTISQKQENYLVQLIQLYPEMIHQMNNYQTNGTTLATRLINLYYVDNPSILQQIYAFAVNYPLIFPETNAERDRRLTLEKLPNTYMGTLYEIYETRNLGVILEMEQHPMELYLIAVSKVQVRDLRNLVQGFGMLVPEHLMTREIRNYVLNWMPNYKDILTRPAEIASISELLVQIPDTVRELIQMFLPYSDQEIIAFFGYISGFENRNVLIQNIYELITEEGFLVLKDIQANRATNVETVMLTELPDLMRPYLVFGSPLSYRVHELDEFIQAWSGGEFRKIVDEGNYTIAQVSKLQSLLPMIPKVNEQLRSKTDELLDIVQKGIIRTMRRSREIDRFIRKVQIAPEEVQALIKSIFWKLFFTGMYMRRWRGPGNAYPTRSTMTRGGGNPEPKVVIELGLLSDMLEQLSVVDGEMYTHMMEMPAITYNTGAHSLTIRRSYIFDKVGDVSQGNMCIRQASSDFTFSAHYYLSVIFSEVIPGFDPYDLESIS